MKKNKDVSDELDNVKTNDEQSHDEVESFKDKDSWESYHELFNSFVGRQGMFVDVENSKVEGVEFEVTGFSKAFVSLTLGITFEFGKGVTEYSFDIEEEGGFPKIDCLVNLVFALVP
ncbi:hypothetical protein Tco_0656343 [Tanacetum coccineum]|uniref:Uncharacterized protein n=1 Tax=Tanacetum coccineum TaxID=301880 RepID=A0ABQ4X8K9_9ASTR